jgi:GxxExxY protein
VPIIIRSVDTHSSLGNHRLDFVVDNNVVVEMKAIKFTPMKMEQQLYTYLRNSVYEIGLMINFGSSKLYIRRLILNNDRK